MKREKVKTTDGESVTILTPENAKDEKEIERLRKNDELEDGGSFADQGQYTENEIDDILGF